MEAIDVGMLAQMRLELEAAEQALAMMEDAPPQAYEEVAALRADVEEVEREQRRRLDALAIYLGQEFERCIRARSNVDKRMWDDIRQYEGRSRLNVPNKRYPTDNNIADGDDQENTIHATRSFTNLFSARVVDMIYPANEVPFRVDPDPHPDLLCIPTFQPPQAQQDEEGNPIEPTEQDIEAALDAANSQAAGAMQNTIKDQLMEGGLQKHGRAMIRDGMKVGVGLLRGPFMQYKRRNKVRFVDGSAEPVVEVDEMTVPGLAYVKPDMFWYDMTPCLSKARKTFEVELYDRSEMMELKKYPNVILGALDELLAEKEPCVDGLLGDTIRNRNSVLGQVEPLDGRWAMVRVFAAINPEKLKEIGGMDWPHESVMPLIEMLMCKGKCVKWKLSELEFGYRVPYYAFTPFPCDDTIYGWSVPYMARSAQAGVDGAWEATKANASIASGAMIFLAKGMFSPKDGAWRQGGPKFFDWTGGNDGLLKIADCVQSLVVPSNVEGNLKLLEVALDNMSKDTMLSQILQGNVTEAAQGPAAGLVQLINLSTIIQRDIASQYDDGVSKPLPEAFGQWNALYNPDPTCKGDFNYAGTASSAFVARDVQTQHLQVLTGMAADPRFLGFTDNWSLWNANVKILDVPDKESICLDRDKALAAQAAMQQSQPDPIAQAKMAEIELGKQKLEADLQIRMKELELEQYKVQLQADISREEMQNKLALAQADLQRAYVEASAQREIDIAALDAQIDKATDDNATKRAVEGAKIGQQAAIDQSKLDLQAQKMAQDSERIALAKTPSPDSALD